MATATILSAIGGYALIYWAHPGRPRVRGRRPARGASVTGGVLLGLAFGISGLAFGPLVGPVIVSSVIMAAASSLVLAVPALVSRLRASEPRSETRT